MKNQIVIKYFSRVHHCSQVITGFYRLFYQSKNFSLVIEDHRNDQNYPYKGPFIEVNILGKVIIYDMLDGYNSPNEILWFYNRCDCYFKRSFSNVKNQELGLDSNIIYPYGFNYFVTYKGNPLDGCRTKDFLKAILGLNHNTIFVTEAFEEIPQYKFPLKVLFSTRLWPFDNCLSDELNAEREYINQMRVEIVKELKDKYGNLFLGGLYDTPLSQKIAPGLIVPDTFTVKKNYLKALHESDICIGSMGLHQSIGGKTGEYIASAKAIVQERLHYSVPGNFIDGVNYLSFSTSMECIHAVEKLINDPQLTFQMKSANLMYYQSYLKPEVLIVNTLKCVMNCIST